MRATFPYTEAHDVLSVHGSTTTSKSVQFYSWLGERKTKTELLVKVPGKLDRQDKLANTTVSEKAGLIFSNLKIKPAFPKQKVSVLSTSRPIDIGQEFDRLTSPKILSSSPVSTLQNLQVGWDGYWAEPLSQQVLLRAHDLWLRIRQTTGDKDELPSVNSAANGSVAFTWSYHYPEKELEIWLYDQPDFYAEWLLSVKNHDDMEGNAKSQTNLLEVVKQYQES